MKIARLLIANRGEIACRVIRTCRRLGIHAIAVHSDADRDALHVRLADEAHAIGPAPARESYLNADAVIAAARAARADAIHPGYGFLSENAAFAEACAAAGIAFVGPPPRRSARWASSTRPRRWCPRPACRWCRATWARTSHPPGWPSEARASASRFSSRRSRAAAARACASCARPASSTRRIRGARGEAESAFGDGRLMLERFLERPRHVEVQVFGDSHGDCVHLFERECSVQRRYQKIIEESPSPFIDAPTRAAMTKPRCARPGRSAT